MQFKKLVSAATLALAASVAWAAPITPSFDIFGTLSAATFGGNGIPNTAVAIDYAVSGNKTATIGLTAHQRYDNPALTNDGAGTFHALPGIDTHAPSPADPYALWNIGYYIGGANPSSFSYTLYYDFSPTAGSGATGYSNSLTLSFLFPRQDSRNLGDNWLALFSPTLFQFDPTATGEYSFALVASTTGRNAQEVARSAIRVLINDVPEPASLALVGIALLGLAGVRRRKA